MGFRQSIVSLYFNRKWKEIRRAQFHPKMAQERAFRRLQASLSQTAYGVERSLSKIKTQKEWAKSLAPQKYVDFKGMVTRSLEGEKNVFFRGQPVYIGLSSGTTGQNSKKIPYNASMVNLFKEGQVSFGAILNHHTPLDLLSDSRLIWGSTYEVQKSHRGVPEGYVSGFIATQTPRSMAKKSFPSADVHQITDMEAKLDLAAAQLRGESIRLMSGVPTYLIKVLEGLKERYGVSKINKIWPKLTTCAYSATAIRTYKETIDQLVGRPLEYFGAYAATEGFFGYEIPSLNGRANGLYSFHLGQEIFYSFRRLYDDQLLSIEELKEGEEVELLITTPNGFINYRTGDCLRMVQTSPTILFEIMGRVGQGINVATEKSSLSHLDKAIHDVAEKLGERIQHYFVRPGKGKKGLPCYSWSLFVENPERFNAPHLARALDNAMKRQNGDYTEARDDLLFMAAPKVEFLPMALLKNYFLTRSHQGQLKMKTAFESESDLQEFISQINKKEKAA